MTLHLLRHLPTDHNAETPGAERIRGWGNQGVSDEGKAMVPKLAQALKRVNPTVIFTSDLPRAKETAELVGKELDIPVLPLQQLRTWNVGDITGKPVSEAKPQLDDLQHRKPQTKAPKGESYAEFFDRWGDSFQTLRSMGKKQDILAVLHGRQVYSAPAHLKGAGMRNIPTHGAPDPGDVLAVDEKAKKLTYVHRSGAAQRATA